MKRAKQTQIIIDTFNMYFRNNQIKDEGNNAFCVMQHALIQCDQYRGYNYIKENGATTDEKNAYCLFLY